MKRSDYSGCENTLLAVERLAVALLQFLAEKSKLALQRKRERERELSCDQAAAAASEA